jgi:hypothetical protein
VKIFNFLNIVIFILQYNVFCKIDAQFNATSRCLAHTRPYNVEIVQISTIVCFQILHLIRLYMLFWIYIHDNFACYMMFSKILCIKEGVGFITYEYEIKAKSTSL